MTNDLPTRIWAHIQTCALCIDMADCEAGAMLFAQVEFEARRRFRLWLDGVETLFFPVADEAWHVRYSFPVNGGHFLTAHYTGNPPGALRSFEQTIDYARACLMSASEDLIDHLRGCRPACVVTGPSIENDGNREP